MQDILNEVFASKSRIKVIAKQTPARTTYQPKVPRMMR